MQAHSKPPQIPKHVWPFVWHYLKDKKWALTGFFVVALGWAIEMSLTPYLLKRMIDVVTAESGPPALWVRNLLWPAVLYVSMSLWMNLNFRLYDYILLRIYPAIKATITQDMFDYLLHHSHAFFQNNFTGTLTKKIFDMVINVERIIQIINDWFYPRLFSIMIASAMLWHVVHPIIGATLGIWSCVFITYSFFVARSAEKYATSVSTAFVKMSGFISDSISNIMSTKLFYNLKHESRGLNQSLDELVSSDRRLLSFHLENQFIQGLLVTALVASMLYLLIRGLSKGWVTAGDFAMVLSLIGWIATSMWDIGKQMLELSKATGTCKQALSFIMEPHDVLDRSDAKPLRVQVGAIEINQVTYAYQNQSPIFSELAVSIHPGEKVGLVGYSGGGKSTFVKLILRLMDCQKGGIFIDQQNIAHVTQSSLRQAIGTIPQETTLFHRSILDNIRFAKPDASDAEVMVAAQKAHADEFIQALPEGYHAWVGEHGVKLSGGQKQRIAIARAFLKNAPILLLDEATSALDTHTERLIQKSLHEVMQNKTTLVIAHRLSTLKDMDRILFFDAGVIVEAGSISELLQDPNSKFSQLWRLQREGFINES